MVARKIPLTNQVTSKEMAAILEICEPVLHSLRKAGHFQAGLHFTDARTPGKRRGTYRWYEHSTKEKYKTLASQLAK